MQQDGQAWAAMRAVVEKDVKKWKSGAKSDEMEKLEAHVGVLAKEVPAAPVIVAEAQKERTAAEAVPASFPSASRYDRGHIRCWLRIDATEFGRAAVGKALRDR